MKVVAIIQARMTSTRLPGKVLRIIAGRTMLDWVYLRTRSSKTIDEIIVATTWNAADDELVKHCRSRGIRCYRGQEADVLDRYYQCAREQGADIVVRVTSDCPLVEPTLIDKVVTILMDFPDVDYAANTLPPRTYPRGLDVEAFRMEALTKTWQNTTEIELREHVTPYIYTHPELFSLKGVYSEVDYSKIRVTVDMEEDLILVTKILNHYSTPYFGWTDMVDYLAQNPGLLNINKDVKQKNPFLQ